MILQLFAWRLMTFLSCLRHFAKLFTKYSGMSLIHPHVISWFWNDPYLILKVLYDLQTHKMTRKTISVFLRRSVGFHSNSLQPSATVQKSQWLGFLQPRLTEIQVCQLRETRRDLVGFFFNIILQMLAENQQGNKTNELGHQKYAIINVKRKLTMMPQGRNKEVDKGKARQHKVVRSRRRIGSQIKVRVEGMIG